MQQPLFKFRLLTAALFLFACIISADTAAQEKYEVISVSRLNVRSKPTTKSPIIGTLKGQEQVDVISTINSWAEIRYKSRTAYVSLKYLKKIETIESVEEVAPVVVEPIYEPEPIPIDTIATIVAERPTHHKQIGKNIGIDFVPAIYGGFSNFATSDATPKGRVGFGVDLPFQFIAKDWIKFIPKDYYMEASLGYALKGSGAFPLHYINIKLSPIGYRYTISDYMLFGKIGIYAGYSFSSMDTNRYSFDTNTDIGILAEVGVEYENIGVGISYERGFTDVCDSNLSLKNQCVFINLSYRLFNFK